jgi:hypothetical protein
MDVKPPIKAKLRDGTEVTIEHYYPEPRDEPHNYRVEFCPADWFHAQAVIPPAFGVRFPDGQLRLLEKLSIIVGEDGSREYVFEDRVPVSSAV